MSNISKAISLLLIAATLLTACAVSESGNSEADNNTSAADTSDGETERSEYKDNLPDDLNFEGKTVVINGRGDGDAILELDSEQTGDIIEDAIYDRNMRVEDRLNVDIVAYTPYGWQSYGSTITQIRSSIQAGDDEFQIIAGYSAVVPVLSTEKLLLNLRALEYIDVDQPWWAQSIVENLTINGNLYFLCGDIALTMLASSYSVAINFAIADNYDITGVYDTVLSGGWTIDKLYELSSLVYEDSNGDGKKNDGDLVGLLIGGELSNDSDSFMQGSKISMTARDENDIPYISVDVDKMSSLTEKVYRLFYENNGALVDTKINAYTTFPNDVALFSPAYLYFYYDFFKGMESDYGILPYPKYDEAQDGYSTRVQDGVSIWSIPVTVADTDCVSATMEAMAAQSYRTVTPIYFETALKVKYSRDEASIAMLDIIRSGVMFNFEIIYNNSIGSPWNILRDLMSSKSKDFASKWAKMENTVTTKLEDVVESFT